MLGGRGPTSVELLATGGSPSSVINIFVPSGENEVALSGLLLVLWMIVATPVILVCAGFF